MAAQLTFRVSPVPQDRVVFELSCEPQSWLNLHPMPVDVNLQEKTVRHTVKKNSTSSLIDHPNLLRIVFHPSRLRIKLRVLQVRRRHDASLTIEDDASRTAGALVNARYEQPAFLAHGIGNTTPGDGRFQRRST